MDRAERRNRTLCRVFGALFLAALVGVWPLWGLLRGVVDTENHENRELAAWPSGVGMEALPAAFEAWLSDHAPFRGQWMEANAALNWGAFRVVDSETVLLGKDGWLFLKGGDETDPLGDYQGTNLYSEERLCEVAAQLAELDAALAGHGIELALVIPPGKEAVYRRYMPEDVPRVSGQSRMDVLAEHLGQNTDVTVVWPEAALRALSEEVPVYYKYDTHWNEAGGAYASALLLEALGAGGPQAGELVFEPSATAPKRDLAMLSATWNIFVQDESWRAAEFWEGRQPALAEKDARGWYERYTCEGAAQQKLLVMRDSFGEDMVLPLAAGYAESVFVHNNAFEAGVLTREKPDVLVLEFSQRYFDLLMEKVPALTGEVRAW